MLPSDTNDEFATLIFKGGKFMGKVAKDNADRVIITDDNPRNEKPEKIRNEILSTCPRAIVIPDRAKAILTAIDKMQEGDVLLLSLIHISEPTRPY